MWLWNKIIGTLTGSLMDKHIAPKVDATLCSLYDTIVVDKQIAKEISEYILQKFGCEVFYNDLDSYIANNNIVENLIANVRGKSNIQPSNRDEFAKIYTQKLISQCKKHITKDVEQEQIYDIFSWMFDFAFSRANCINPHTDSGKLQNELHRIDSTNEMRTDKTYAAIESMRRETAVRDTEILNRLSAICGSDDQNFECCPVEIDTFMSDIKSIELEYQQKNKFEDAVLKYYELLQSISGRISGQNKKFADSLICTLNCNIALCQANLDGTDKAYRSLNSIPKSAADCSKTYHFVYAAITILHGDPTRYSDAQIHLDRALEIDSQYHRAFLLRQYLYALLGIIDYHTNIEELNIRFAQVLSENSDKKLISDYYMNRGVICLTYEDPYSASDDFYKAIEYGSDDVVAKLNLSASLYAQVVISLPKGKRFFHPNVDFAKIIAVLTQLQPVVTNANIDTPQYKLIAEKVIELYVSSCSIVGIPHGLSPLAKYLGLTCDYETQRALILGSQEDLSDITMSLLDESDYAFIQCRTLLANNKFDECRKKLEGLYSIFPERISAPLFDILLQVLIATKDTKSYWKYRAFAASSGIDSSILDAMDACANEWDGKLEEAKILFDNIATTSNDYQLLDNSLRFFKRNKFNSECATLYFRIQELYKKRILLIDDLDVFYIGAINFFTSIDSPLSEKLLEQINIQEVSQINYLHIQTAVYSKTNDVNRLVPCLEQIFFNNHCFQNGLNLALGQKLLMNYDCSLKTCLELLKDTTKNDELAKLYWLISNLYLLKENHDESYIWALKTHDLMIQNPYDQSHQALFGRALRCGHQEGFAKILEYKNTHPVVVDWIQAFSIGDGENPIESLTKQLEKYSPDAYSYTEQEKDLASRYRNQIIPINLVLEYYRNDLGPFFVFAEKNKIRISMGNRDQLKNEENSIDQNVVVDALTLIILAYYGCLSVLQSIEHIHINYGSLNMLQNYYLSFNYPYVNLLLKWIESADNITFHPDGFIEDDSMVVKALSRNFIACYTIANDKSIPFLYSDSVTYAFATSPEVSMLQKAVFVSIPALCNHYGQTHPKERDQMLYRLLKGCSFVSFSASTIIEQIESNDNLVSYELMRPFLICKSSYDMKSFAAVYLQAINGLYVQNSAAAVKLSEIIIEDAFRVWRRGTTYRMMSQEYSSEEDKSRALAISRYAYQIATSIKQIVPTLPTDFIEKCEELEKTVVTDFKNNYLHNWFDLKEQLIL